MNYVSAATIARWSTRRQHVSGEVNAGRSHQSADDRVRAASGSRHGALTGRRARALTPVAIAARTGLAARVVAAMDVAGTALIAGRDLRGDRRTLAEENE